MNYQYSSVISQPDEHTFLCGLRRVRRYGTTLSLEDSVPTEFIDYYVKPDDTLQGIALKYDCSVSEIVRFNRLWSANALHIKTIIRIPSRNNKSQNINSTSTNTGKTTRKEQPPFTEQESLSDILRRIDKSTQQVSQQLQQSPRIQPTVTPTTYSSGDSYQGI